MYEQRSSKGSDSERLSSLVETIKGFPDGDKDDLLVTNDESTIDGLAEGVVEVMTQSLGQEITDSVGSHIPSPQNNRPTETGTGVLVFDEDGVEVTGNVRPLAT